MQSLLFVYDKTQQFDFSNCWVLSLSIVQLKAVANISYTTDCKRSFWRSLEQFFTQITNMITNRLAFIPERIPHFHSYKPYRIPISFLDSHWCRFTPCGGYMASPLNSYDQLTGAFLSATPLFLPTKWTPITKYSRTIKVRFNSNLCSYYHPYLYPPVRHMPCCQEDLIRCP